MAGELIWSRAALDDLDAIAAFIARGSVIHARRVTEKIFECGDLLLTQPAIGQIVPESNQDRVREHSLYGFRIIFERQGEDLHLLAVIHGHRLMDSIPRRFQGL